ncbi:MAG: methionyl-tRNA formyltransferase [Gammaproteobacteria bacterium]|nr:methionyl-tRNA formyltransferase [Gammaproteobacteria bacterium]
MSSLTTVFAGSPAFAATILSHLAKTPFLPAAVYTQPDRPSGRGRKMASNAVKQYAQQLDLPTLQPNTLRNPTAAAQLRALKPDVLIVAAYGLILPAEILAIPTYGCINVHASLLPRWRGAAPIERAIINGDKLSGVCIMQMDAGLDTGPVFKSHSIAIDTEITADQLEDEMAHTGAKALIDVLAAINLHHQGKGPRPKPQKQPEHEACYAHKLTAADRKIDWLLSAEQLANQIRALSSRQPVRVSINACGVQLLAARPIEQPTDHQHREPPGTIIGVSKSGILVQCETNVLQITTLKVERGSGKKLDPAAAANGFKDLFYTSAQLV